MKGRPTPGRGVSTPPFEAEVRVEDAAWLHEVYEEVERIDLLVVSMVVGFLYIVAPSEVVN